MPPMVGVQKRARLKMRPGGSRLWCCAPARYCYFWRCSGRGENRNLSRQYEREVKTGKPGAQTDQTRTTVEITTAALEDVVGIQDVLYRTWLATYPSETFGINVDDIEEMYKDRNSEATLAKRREQVSRPQETTLVAKEKDKVVGLCRIIKREDKSVMEAIYILPEYQRLGVGSSVWREAQKLLDPKKDVVVQVATYNTA